MNARVSKFLRALCSALEHCKDHDVVKFDVFQSRLTLKSV